MITKEISKNLCQINDFAFKEFLEISEIDENEAKYLSDFNQMRKLSAHSSNSVLIKDYFEKSQSVEQKPVKIRHIYSINRLDDHNTFVKCGYNRQRRLLLWHGTKSKNLTGILRHGFRLPISDKLLFGKGIYFADRVTKSCDYSDQIGSGILLLCEVCVGSMYITETPHPFIRAPQNYDSIKAIGKLIPKPNVIQVLENSTEVPIGKTVDNIEVNANISVSELNFNEYVVFEPQRILIKFIIHFDWT